jgi:succinate dehydrogenase / fumarate reductase iron-sulfur subunit
VLREHGEKPAFAGPRFLVRVAGLETHPMDAGNRTMLLKDEMGIGYCNITKCCSEVCPEDIHITDNAIIPLKERVVDEHYDPVMKVIRFFTGSNKKEG